MRKNSNMRGNQPAKTPHMGSKSFKCTPLCKDCSFSLKHLCSLEIIWTHPEAVASVLVSHALKEKNLLPSPPLCFYGDHGFSSYVASLKVFKVFLQRPHSFCGNQSLRCVPRSKTQFAPPADKTLAFVDWSKKKWLASAKCFGSKCVCEDLELQQVTLFLTWQRFALYEVQFHWSRC